MTGLDKIINRADLVVIDMTIWKDRSGQYGRKGEPIEFVPTEGFENIECVKEEAGMVMSFSGDKGTIIIIATQPIKFEQIK